MWMKNKIKVPRKFEYLVSHFFFKGLLHLETQDETILEVEQYKVVTASPFKVNYNYPLFLVITPFLLYTFQI